jgi:hypothetical protein
MSTIGGMSAAALNVASSVVASSRPEAVGEKAQTQAAHQQAQAALPEASDDIEDAQFSPDRDADGRQLYRRPAPLAQDAITSEADEAVASGPAPANHPADAFGDRGNALDLDA